MYSPQAFFDTTDDSLLRKLTVAAQNLKAAVSNPNPDVDDIVSKLHQKWKVLQKIYSIVKSTACAL